jgi:hypothetical protein
VIRRLSRKVDTRGLIKLTILTGADCTTMREAFGPLFSAASQPAWRDQFAADRTVRDRRRDQRLSEVDRRHPNPSGEGRMTLDGQSGFTSLDVI